MSRYIRASFMASIEIARRLPAVLCHSQLILNPHHRLHILVLGQVLTVLLHKLSFRRPLLVALQGIGSMRHMLLWVEHATLALGQAFRGTTIETILR